MKRSATAVRVKPKKRGRGRPRVNEPGSQITYTNLPPAVREIVDQLATEHRWSTSLMIAQLVEEALKFRKKLK